MNLPNPLRLAQLLNRMTREEAALVRVSTAPEPTEHLLDFATAVDPFYRPELVHALMANALEDVVMGQTKRLMIFAPPQHGKSHLTSVLMPAFWFGKRPDDPVILTSYGSNLAEDKSRQIRTIVESEDYRQIFPDISLKADSRAVGLWHLEGFRGKLLAAGAGGPITGHGGMLGIIDDPIANWEDAQSENIRTKTWDWYKTTFRTRIWEGGAIVLIMTRWHEMDLAGMILNSSGAKDWTVLRLPALSETQEVRDRNNKLCGLPAGLQDPLGRKPGLPLSPKRFSLATMLELKRDTAQAWEAEYQGAPSAPEGNRIKRSWLKVIPKLPVLPQGRVYKRVRFWDKAATEGHGDYTVGVLIAYDEADHKFYIEDVVRGQWSSGTRDIKIAETVLTDWELSGFKNYEVGWEQEPGSGGKDSAIALAKILAAFPSFFATASGSKEVRAEPFAGAAENGFVSLIHADWNDAYIDELTSFPNGRNDDQLDATSGAYNRLALVKPKRKLISY